MKVGNYYLLAREIEGFYLVASELYWKASEEEIKAHTGGCGPGKLGDYFVPDTMYGESIFLACQIHDWMYYEGKTLEDKRIADLVFLVNMTILINDGELLDKLRLQRVMTYYQAVSDFGQDAFEQ
jgi:hypothetical protein